MTTSRSKQVNSLLFFSGLGVALPALFLYWQTSYPTVAYIDSGELAIVNWTLGIAHPTGYPLYTLIGRLFSLLPIELIKTQILLGMLCTAWTVVIVSFLGTLHVPAGTRSVPLRQWLCRMALGLLLAVSPLLWSQGVTNEVYSLHLVILSLLLLILLQPYSDRNLILGGYLLGLSFGNHMSTILIVPTIIAYLVVNRRAVFRSSTPTVTAVVAGLLAASIYLYLPIRSALDPMFNWGHPTTWESFLRHVSGWQYQVWMFNRSASQLGNQLVDFAGILYVQFPLPFWLLIVFGLYRGIRARRTLLVYLLILMACNLVYSLNFEIPDIDNYLLPSVIVLFLFGAFGATQVAGVKPLYGRLMPALMAALIVWGLIVNWETNNESKNTSAMDGVHNYFKSVEPNALILCTGWDYTSPWFYSHFYLKERPDVVIVDPELVRRSWYPDWIRHADPQLYDAIKPEIDAFLPHVRQFERKELYDRTAIEKAFRAVLKKMTSYSQRPVYYDYSAELGFPPPGEVRVSGQLYRIVRAGENFTPPTETIPPPSFGKSRENLDRRADWHLREYLRMQQQR